MTHRSLLEKLPTAELQIDLALMMGSNSLFKWHQGLEGLPKSKRGAEYLMVLDGIPQRCVETVEDGDNQRWFYGDISGAYPEREITAWAQFNAPGNEEANRVKLERAWRAGYETAWFTRNPVQDRPRHSTQISSVQGGGQDDYPIDGDDSMENNGSLKTRITELEGLLGVRNRLIADIQQSGFKSSICSLNERLNSAVASPDELVVPSKIPVGIYFDILSDCFVRSDGTTCEDQFDDVWRPFRLSFPSEAQLLKERVTR